MMSAFVISASSLSSGLIIYAYFFRICSNALDSNHVVWRQLLGYLGGSLRNGVSSGFRKLQTWSVAMAWKPDDI